MIHDCTAAGLIDFMDDHQPGPVIYLRDEINDVFRAISELNSAFQLNSILLEMYKRPDYRYQRVKKGGKKAPDTVSINGVHLSVMGGATPAIYADLNQRVVENGLLGRFIMVTEAGRGALRHPTQLDRSEIAEWSVAEQMLAADLDHIYDATDGGPYEIRFTDEAFAATHKLQDDISAKYVRDYAEAIPCFARIGTEACYRTAALVALSRKGANPKLLVVNETDVEVSIRWCRRWLKNAISAVRNSSSTINMRCAEKVLNHAVKMCQNGSRVVERTDLMRRLRLTSREAKETEETLKLQGAIEVKLKDREAGKAGRPCVQWVLTDRAFDYAAAPSPASRMILTYEEAPPYPDEAPGSSEPF
jgi:hypothetical protein